MVKTAQFLAIILTALAVVPSGAHLLALPNKLEFEPEAYLTAQQIYRGWAWLGTVIIAALASNMIAALLLRRQPLPFWLSTATTVLIAGTLVIFFLWTFPANQLTANWTSLPPEPEWHALRNNWEYSHASNAIIMFLALCCSALAALFTQPRVKP